MSNQTVKWPRNPSTGLLDPKYGTDPDEAILLSRLDLSAGIPVSGGWGFGATDGGEITAENDGDHIYLRGVYPIDVSGDGSGANYIFGGYTPEDRLQEVYITIYARMPLAKYGMKFCKLFGEYSETNGGNYANSTFGLDYTGVDFGCMYFVAYGDGTELTNDTANGVEFTTPSYFSAGRAPSPAIVRGGRFDSDDWGDGWHKFQIRWKYNSGTSSENETPDGAFAVWIDGVLHASAENLFNRNPVNGFLDTINFFGYSRGQNQQFEMHMRDITVSLNGWVD